MLSSIITVTRNNLDGLKATAHSVKAQSSSDYEWLVIDGNSDDGSKEYLASLNSSPLWGEDKGEGHKNENSNKDSSAPHPTLSPRGRRLNFISEPDAGIYDAMNKGLARAKGDYLIFLNAGDVFASEEILSEIKIALEKNDIRPGFIYGDSIENGHPKIARSHRKIMQGLFTHHQAMFYRREDIGKLRYDTSYEIAADYDFTCRFLAKNTGAFYIPLPICIFETGGISQRQVEKGRREQAQIRETLNMCGPLRNNLIMLRQKFSWFLRTKTPGLFWYVKGFGGR
jgi:putative colanic acid biosynthesis glycosyltransferase